MTPELYVNANRFSFVPIRTEGRLLLQSTCLKCGASKLVTLSDDSLDKWIKGHTCHRRCDD